MIGGQTYVTEYGYDLADRQVQIVYPSGRIVDYARDSIGRVTGVTTRADAASASVTIATEVTWQSFGPLDGLNWGDGSIGTYPLTRTYDLDGRLSSSAIFDNVGFTGTQQDLSYGYDLAGNIETITDNRTPASSETYDYDELHRLTGATGAYGTEGWDYDAVGNRIARTAGAVSETYAYDAFSNRLLNVAAGGGTRTLTYGDSGNTASDDDGAGAVLGFAYDSTDRLVGVSQGAAVLGAYTHNAMGQRVAKTAGGATTHFLHGLSGRLLAEHSGGGGVAREYFWLDGQLLGGANALGQGAFVATDHIGRPTRVIGWLTGLVRWNAVYRPFGELHSETGTEPVNLRFPGQYADAETGLYYNYFRDYDAATGRYIQSDPIGLRGGWNTYAYVGGNPIAWADPKGLTRDDVNAMLDIARRNSGGLSVPTCITYRPTGPRNLGGYVRGSGLFYISHLFEKELSCDEIKELYRVIIHESAHRSQSDTEYVAKYLWYKMWGDDYNRNHPDIYEEGDKIMKLGMPEVEAYCVTCSARYYPPAECPSF